MVVGTTGRTRGRVVILRALVVVENTAIGTMAGIVRVDVVITDGRNVREFATAILHLLLVEIHRVYTERLLYIELGRDVYAFGSNEDCSGLSKQH